MGAAAAASSMVTNDATHFTYRMSRQNNRRERERSNTRHFRVS